MKEMTMCGVACCSNVISYNTAVGDNLAKVYIQVQDTSFLFHKLFTKYFLKFSWETYKYFKNLLLVSLGIPKQGIINSFCSRNSC